MKTYRAKIEVRGYELDSFGHVNNSVYLNYLEHARWKMLKEEGITLPLLEELKRWPVITGMEIKYLKPTFMGDVLEVETHCAEYGKASFVLEQVITRDGTPVFKARVHSVTVNENGRPSEYPERFARIWT